MLRFSRSLLLLTLILLIPIVPFLLWGERIEAWGESIIAEPPSRSATAMLIVGLLSTDILLPVPSSLVSTLAGSQLGVLGGTLASWLGMTIGAVIGFAIAKAFGRAVALRFSSKDDLERMESLTGRLGPAALIVTRAVPVLAEACVLLVGVHRLSWRRFLPPVLLANLGIALAYSVFGEIAAANEWLPVALGIAIAVPLLLLFVARRWLKKL
jgi:uncharacterized membrane protein YdjX (TVP38/TMEM64 family)